jgi:hypothetical protein
MSIYDTAANVINDCAVEVGLTAVADPYGSSDPGFIQLCRMLTTAGRELIGVHQWQRFIGTYSVTTTALDTGSYTLPTDYLYMLDQTGWTPTNRLPLGGPLSPQDYAFIVGSGWNQYTIYISFTESAGTFKILPNNPVPAGVTITFSYIRNAFGIPAGVTDPLLFVNRITASDTTILFPPILIAKLLKLRFLEAKGFDTTAALGQYNTALATWLPKDKSSPVLNMGCRRLFPYLDVRNVPETNFGS